MKNVFLNGDLDEKVYMGIPHGLEKAHDLQKDVEKKKKKRSPYRLKQSPRTWFEKFTNSVKKDGCSQAQTDHTMFFKHSTSEKVTIPIVYMDDIIVTSDAEIEILSLKKLAPAFEVKDRGALKYFLGMEVARTKKGISISQMKYILDLLEETRKLGCKPSDTLIVFNKKIRKV